MPPNTQPTAKREDLWEKVNVPVQSRTLTFLSHGVGHWRSSLGVPVGLLLGGSVAGEWSACQRRVLDPFCKSKEATRPSYGVRPGGRPGVRHGLLHWELRNQSHRLPAEATGASSEHFQDVSVVQWHKRAPHRPTLLIP